MNPQNHRYYRTILICYSADISFVIFETVGAKECVCVVIFDVFGTRATKNIVCFNGTLMPICLYTGIYIFKWTVFPLKFDQQSAIIKTQPHRTNEYFQSLDYFTWDVRVAVLCRCFVIYWCWLTFKWFLNT